MEFGYLLGMTEELAVKTITASGWTARVTLRNGDSLRVETDHNPYRVNLEIVDDVVKRYYIG